MNCNPSNPIIVQGDKSVLLGVESNFHEEIRDGVILQAADADLLAGLMGSPNVRHHLDRRLSADVALLKAGREKAWVDGPVKEGYSRPCRASSRKLLTAARSSARMGLSIPSTPCPVYTCAAASSVLRAVV
jgi:hypothetical protein